MECGFADTPLFKGGLIILCILYLSVLYCSISFCFLSVLHLLQIQCIPVSFPEPHLSKGMVSKREGESPFPFLCFWFLLSHHKRNVLLFFPWKGYPRRCEAISLHGRLYFASAAARLSRTAVTALEKSSAPRPRPTPIMIYRIGIKDTW